jgi:hypothetical protein
MAAKKKDTPKKKDAPKAKEEVAAPAAPSITQAEKDFGNGFVRVKSGEHKGRYGAFLEVTHFDADGNPETALMKTRDDDHMLLPVAYKDLEAAESGER